MLLAGLQKLTLLDYPGLVACTVFTGGCNLRCPFCHNAALVLHPQETLTLPALLTFLEKRRGQLDGVCLTGGEPLLHPDCKDLLTAVKALGFSVKLDTNGCFPDQLQALVADGLVDYVAMDIKNDPAHYAETVGLPAFDLTPVEESVRYLLTKPVPFEFRTTVVREFHDLPRLLAIAAWLGATPAYFLQSFVDSGGLIATGLSGYTPEELEAFRAALPMERAALRGV
ncbi:MAG: anaerobic ribonucleoside-triphosphate reductase activating protein [Oscillospiraceae bacterium]